MAPSNYCSISVNSYDFLGWAVRCRLRGKIDSNGCTGAFLEERLNMGLNFILSAEFKEKDKIHELPARFKRDIDHKKKDYKFGFGLTVGE